MSSKTWQPLNEKSYFSWSASWYMLNFSLNAGYLPVTWLVCYAASKLSEKQSTSVHARATPEHLIPPSYQLLTCSKAFNLASSRRNLVQLKQAVETETLQLMA